MSEYRPQIRLTPEQAEQLTQQINLGWGWAHAMGHHNVASEQCEHVACTSLRTAYETMRGAIVEERERQTAWYQRLLDRAKRPLRTE